MWAAQEAVEWVVGTQGHTGLAPKPPCQPAQENRGLTEKHPTPTILLPPSGSSGKGQGSNSKDHSLPLPGRGSIALNNLPQQDITVTMLKARATRMVPGGPLRVGVVGYGRLGESKLAWGLLLWPHP